jgi:AcrR family transcriptional regulator
MSKNPTQTRALLLNSAHTIVAQQGIQHLTLEAVAQAAGISKGGLLYHYPSKEALIEGMIAYYLDAFEQELQALLPESMDNGDRAYIHAYVRASFAPSSEAIEQSAGLMAAVAVNPSLLEPLRQQYAVWQARFEAALPDRALATVIRLAVDGLWVSDLLGLAPITDERRVEVLHKLLALIEGNKS